MKKFRMPHFIIMAFIIFIAAYAHAQVITYLNVGGSAVLQPHDKAACDRENVSPHLSFLSSCLYDSTAGNNAITVNGLNFSTTGIEGSIFPSAARDRYVYLDVSYSDIVGITKVGFVDIAYTHGSITFKGVPFKYYGLYQGSYVYERETGDDSIIPYIDSCSYTYNTCTADSPDNSSSNYLSGVIHISYGDAASCPVASVLGPDSAYLENFRAFRDGRLAQSAIGRKAIQLYYNNADSINAALERSPKLRAFTKRVLEIIAPMVGKK